MTNDNLKRWLYIKYQKKTEKKQPKMYEMEMKEIEIVKGWINLFSNIITSHQFVQYMEDPKIFNGLKEEMSNDRIYIMTGSKKYIYCGRQKKHFYLFLFYKF